MSNPNRLPVPARKIEFDDAESVIAQAQLAFHEAAKAAVAENDRLGIVTHGAIGGKLVERHPPRVVPFSED